MKGHHVQLSVRRVCFSQARSSRTLWHWDFDAFVASASQGVHSFEHSALVRWGRLDIVVCTPDVSNTFRDSFPAAHQ